MKIKPYRGRDPQPKMTQGLLDLIARDKRITGYSIEADGVFIYTDSSEWSDDSGAGTFRGDNATEAMKRFKERVRATPGSLTESILNYRKIHG